MVSYISMLVHSYKSYIVIIAFSKLSSHIHMHKLPPYLPLQIRSHASLCRVRNHGTEGKYDWADRSSQTTFEHIILKYKKQKIQKRKIDRPKFKVKTIFKKKKLKDVILSYRDVYYILYMCIYIYIYIY
jgi:hypothetical protein